MRRVVGVEANLIPDRGGVFDVLIDGNLVFSKSEVDRFPEPNEISNILKPQQ